MIQNRLGVSSLNGEMHQICLVAAAAKKALRTKSAIAYTPLKYENRAVFKFYSNAKLFRSKPHMADSVSAWYSECLQRGMRDIVLLAPTSVNERALLGFSNTTQSIIECFFENRITYFTAQWEFDTTKNVWNIAYTEHEWENAPKEKPRFYDNYEDFKNVLARIKELALNIGCEDFAKRFQKALDTLEGSSAYIDIAFDLPMPDIPEKHMRLFEAASAADVFGAMGSWNDSPPHLANEKGLKDAYESLSKELLKQLRLAILYAINEW